MSPLFSRHYHADIIQDAPVEIVTAPYQFGEFTDLLKANGIRFCSRSWRDYERGKSVIRSIEAGDPSQSQYYQRYLGYVMDWVGV